MSSISNVGGGEWDDKVSLNDSSQISKIEMKNQSISSSLKESLSRAEDCIQKDVLFVIDQDSMVKIKNYSLEKTRKQLKPRPKKRLQHGGESHRYLE